MIVGTAGHIDHGKTALVRALTGVDADRLKEEKARGITIELGFAYADVGGGGVTGFIDVPGHERLIHTMVAGAGGIDFALLVVAADDGIMPQTREHLAILDLLGVSRGAVALTKCDVAREARRQTLISELDELLHGTTLAGSPIVPLSAVTGEGIASLRAILAEAERSTALRQNSGRLRLPVDRAFSLAGVGTVVTGTVFSGEVAVGDEVAISPSGLMARVRSIHAQDASVERGVEGQRCALGLVGSRVEPSLISRGDIVVEPGLHAPTDRIDAELRILPSEERPLAEVVPAHLHTGANEVGARVVPLDGPIAPGGSGLVQFVLARPVAAAVLDRFILRNAAAGRTVGGGRFLDLRAPNRRRRSSERIAYLHAAAAVDPAEAVSRLLAVEPKFVDLQNFARDRALAAVEAERAAGAAARLGTFLLSPETLERLRTSVGEALAGFHAESPDLQGLGRERLRLAVTPRLPEREFATFLREEADAGRAVLEGAFVRLPGHEVRLSAADESHWWRFERELGGDERFRPPRVRDISGALGVDERDVRRILKLCARAGRVDQVAHDHFFLRATTAEMVRIAVEVAGDGWFSAASFRDRMNNGRKVAIQVLDFFDRHRVTLRKGDLRRINPRRVDLFEQG